MGHTRGLGTARDYQVTDGNLGYGVCIHITNTGITTCVWMYVCPHTEASAYLPHLDCLGPAAANDIVIVVVPMHDLHALIGLEVL